MNENDRRQWSISQEAMMRAETPEIQEERLRGQAQLREYVFTSSMPVVGGLIARLRSAWNNVATRWYVRPLAEQQSAFNHELLGYVAGRFAALEQRLYQVELRVPHLDELDQRLVAQDQRQVELTYDLGEVVAQLGQLARRLEAIEARMGVGSGE
jgi:hypothetical protein